MASTAPEETLEAVVCLSGNVKQSWTFIFKGAALYYFG